MTRSLVRAIITVTGTDSEALYLQNASVSIFRTGTTTTPVMYAAMTGGSALANPILSNSNGEVVAWLDPAEANVVDLQVNSNGGLAFLANQPSKLQSFPTFTKTLQANAATGTAGVGVPVGGTTGQVLDKASGADFDTAWHTLVAGDVGAASTTDSRLSDTRTPTDASVTPAKFAASAIDAAAGVASSRTLGTGAQQAMPGNTAALPPSGAASGDLTGTYPAPTIAAGKVTDAAVSASAAIAESKLNLASDAAAGTASRRTLGSGAQQAMPGNTVIPALPRPPINEQAFTTPGTATWTAPTAPAGCAPYTRCRVIAFSGGAGGGSGRRGAAGTVRCGGGGGGGGAKGDVEFDISAAGSTQTVTVGAGGAGGAAVTTNDTNGNTGTAGGTSTFGALAGAWNQGSGVGGGGGTATGGASGAPAAVPNIGGAGASASTTGGVAVISSGGIGGVFGGVGGGGGGGVTSADSPSNGGASQVYAIGGYSSLVSGGGTPGGNGVAGISATAAQPFGGCGGSGGAGSITGAAGAGGAGGTFGGGGGGGGASLNGNASGAGGAGAAGCVIVICT